MWARRFEERRRSGEQRWRRSEGGGKKRKGESFAEVIARREYAAMHQELDVEVLEAEGDEPQRLADRLRSPRIGHEEKKRILVWLAHRTGPAAQRALQRYVSEVDRGLEHFAHVALEEAAQIEASGLCQMTRRSPCACASGRTLKDCCGRSL